MIEEDNNFIKMIKLNSEFNGLKPFVMENLRHVIVLTGPNGSGKTRLLKLLAEYLRNKNECSCKNFSIYPENAEDKFIVSDFSHYDAPLQLPSSFPYFVISLTNNRLRGGEFANIDKEALLYIQCIAWHNKDEFKQFNSLLEKIIGEQIYEKNKKLTFFNLEFNNMNLSPGQQYLLRLCVVLFYNQRKWDYSNEYKRVLILDEPEMHLHPGVLLNVIDTIQDVFKNTQIWIATHSITLLSKFDSADIWYMKKGIPKQMNSNSYEILTGLLAEKGQKINYREKLEYFIQLPDIFSLCEFAKESLKEALSLPLKERTDGKPDVQVELAKQTMFEDFDISLSIKNKKIVDFGAGKGRFLEGLTEDDINQFEYYAYNIANGTANEDKNRCETLLNNKYGENGARDRYFEKITDLHTKYEGQIDCVLLMNVLHEINPCQWEVTFKNEIRPLLSDDGRLVIIEVEELTRGENASSCGFLMLTKKSSEKLFNNVETREPSHINKKRKIIAYIIKSKQLDSIHQEKIRNAIASIQMESMEKIKEIRENSRLKNNGNPHQNGIHHAFWLHQYANASIALDSLKKE